MDKKWYIIGGIVLVLVLSFYRNRNNNIETQVEETPIEEIITKEDGTIVKKTGDLIEEMSPQEMENLRNEISEKVAESQVLEMTSAEGQAGNGKSYRVNEDNNYFQKITIEGVTPPAKGYFYEAWLEDETGKQISIGRLEMNGSSGSIYYSAKENRTNYKTVVISREIEDGNNARGEVVLRGRYE